MFSRTALLGQLPPDISADVPAQDFTSLLDSQFLALLDAPYILPAADGFAPAPPDASVAVTEAPAPTHVEPPGPTPDSARLKRQRLLKLFPEYLKAHQIESFTLMFGPRASMSSGPLCVDPNTRETGLRMKLSSDVDAVLDDADALNVPENTPEELIPFRSKASLRRIFHTPDESEDYKDNDVATPAVEITDAVANSDSIDYDDLDDICARPLMLFPWEEKIMWDGMNHNSAEQSSTIAVGSKSTLDRDFYAGELSNFVRFSPRNPILEYDNSWLDIFKNYEEGFQESGKPSQATLKTTPGLSRHVARAPNIRNGKDLQHFAIDRFNISNDVFYEGVDRMAANSRGSSGIYLQHAPPALRLHTPFYKPELSTNELRSLHRTKLNFTAGQEIKFSKVRTLRKKKIKGKENIELLRTSLDITLQDTGNYTLLEYSEESPCVLSNKGMASIIFNYYRKKDDRDNFCPNLDIGTSNILKPAEEGPFWRFGDLDRGETLHVLYNNMLRAPIYRHEVPETDFMLIRQQTKSNVRWYIREIPSIFVVGQTLPSMEIPHPTSRAYTEYKRHRIRTVAYKLCKKLSETQRKGIRFSDVKAAFPNYPDVQLKARLKEFMEGRGLPAGHWRLRTDHSIPTEEEIRRTVTPEQVCIFESTAAAARQLEDLGYAFGGRDCSEAEKEALNLEHELAPWKTTKNFLLAAGNKLLLRLEGPGDPTGCGEGFSILRSGGREKVGGSGVGSSSSGAIAADAVMVGVSVGDAAADADSIAGVAGAASGEQIRTTKQKIKEIWDRQRRTLSKSAPSCPPIEQCEQGAQSPDGNRVLLLNGTLAAAEDSRTDFGEVVAVPRREGISMLAAGEKPKGSYLIVRRRMKNSTQLAEEIVTDMRVVRAYLRIKGQSSTAGTDDPPQSNGNTLFLHEESTEFAHFPRVIVAAHTGGGKTIGPDGVRVTRKVHCRRCGEVGHIKTNREKCPAWQDDEEGVRKGARRGFVPTFRKKRGRRRKSSIEREMAENIDLEFLEEDRIPEPQWPIKRTQRQTTRNELAFVLGSILSAAMTLPEAGLCARPPGGAPRSLHGMLAYSRAQGYESPAQFLYDLRTLAEWAARTNSDGAERAEAVILRHVEQELERRAPELHGDAEIAGLATSDVVTAWRTHQGTGLAVGGRNTSLAALLWNSGTMESGGDPENEDVDVDVV